MHRTWLRKSRRSEFPCHRRLPCPRHETEEPEGLARGCRPRLNADKVATTGGLMERLCVQRRRSSSSRQSRSDSVSWRGSVHSVVRGGAGESSPAYRTADGGMLTDYALRLSARRRSQTLSRRNRTRKRHNHRTGRRTLGGHGSETRRKPFIVRKVRVSGKNAAEKFLDLEMRDELVEPMRKGARMRNQDRTLHGESFAGSTRRSQFGNAARIRAAFPN